MVHMDQVNDVVGDVSTQLLMKMKRKMTTLRMKWTNVYVKAHPHSFLLFIPHLSPPPFFLSLQREHDSKEDDESEDIRERGSVLYLGMATEILNLP